MRWIDQFAYGNHISRLNPAVKAGISLLILLTALIANHIFVSLFLLFLILLLIVFWAKLPAKAFFKILLGESSFLLLAVLGVAVSVSTIPSEGARSFLGLWVSVTPDSLTHAVNLLLRAITCAASMNFLAMTTPITDIIYLLGRLRVPGFLIDIMTLIYRFIFTLFDVLSRMITAKEARLGFRDINTSMRSWGDIGTGLFLEAFRQSQRLEMAMESRCWDGSLRVLPQSYEPFRWFWKRGTSNS